MPKAGSGVNGKYHSDNAECFGYFKKSKHSHFIVLSHYGVQLFEASNRKVEIAFQKCRPTKNIPPLKEGHVFSYALLGA